MNCGTKQITCKLSCYPFTHKWKSSGFLPGPHLCLFLESRQKHSWICPKWSLLAQTQQSLQVAVSWLPSGIRQASIGLRDMHLDQVKTCPAIKAHQQTPATEGPSFRSNAPSQTHHKSAFSISHWFLVKKPATPPPPGVTTSLTSPGVAGGEWKMPRPCFITSYSRSWFYHWSQFFLLIFLLWVSVMSLWLGRQASSPIPDQETLLPGKTLIMSLFWHWMFMLP